MLDREFIDFQSAVAGEYSLERELGRGGMGIVYLAREVQLDRLVAVKVLPQAFAARDDIRERFKREARMAASLSHPHIVPIYRVGEAKGFVFFAMAYVSGETLGERLRSRGPLSPAVATRMMREVAWALSYAHGRGIVHRDIKPDNILIEAETGRSLVTDFGIARGAEETALSDPGRVMGTAHFMSPEQASSEPLDGRSDIYSLGVVSFLALSGKLPFDAPSVPALLMKQVAAEAPSVTSVARSLPPSLAAVVDRCLCKDPSERFATGEEVAEALDATRVARANIPIALRVWTQARDPMRPLYIAWTGILSVTFVSQMLIAALLHSGHRSDWSVIITLGLFPVVPSALFHARKTYQALSAGYTLRDLRAALTAWQRERREEVAFDFDRVDSRWAHVTRGITYALIGGAGILVISALTGTFVGRVVLESLTGGAAVAKLAFATVIGGSIVGVAASNALGVRLISKRIRPKLVGGLRSLFWNSRVGEWAAKLLTPRNRKPIADLDYRPTEMALGVAAGELYAALPKAFRERMPDLPDVVARLEAHATEARARVEELEALMAIGGSERARSSSTATVAARDAAKRELADSVAALEAVRLDLLRLHGGAVDLQPITTVLEAARELGDQLDRLTDAKREADDIAGLPLSLDLRPHTPV